MQCEVANVRMRCNPTNPTTRYAVSTRWEKDVNENGATKDFHRYCCCMARRIGNLFILCERRDGSPLVIAGPCWPFCCLVTMPLILGISGAVAYFVIINEDSPLVSQRNDPYPWWHVNWQLVAHWYHPWGTVQPFWVAYIYFPVLGFVLASLFCVSCQDPGLMERVTEEEAGEGGWFWNEQVGSFRPPGALYCRECGVLIQDYDHLWVESSLIILVDVVPKSFSHLPLDVHGLVLG